MICCNLRIGSRNIRALDYNQFVSNDKTIDAVVRNFEIIGEAAHRIDSHFRDSNPEIEWKRIRGFRNRIVHDYFGIDHDIVWSNVESYLDELIDWLDTIIDKNKAT
ncbi:HepT-like ribonuclease domain-containing protein [Algoriphagus resistens]|uniref:HepT-like ribonuclease domain-containing protein n=1 Tax=Algoriphagus resistens TaxID=1750590 RepID=UPI000AD8B22F